MLISDNFKKILREYPKNIKNTPEEKELYVWLNKNFHDNFKEFFRKELLIGFEYEIKLKTNNRPNLPKFFEIDVYDEKFINGLFNKFFSYLLFNHYTQELELGFKVSITSDYKLRNRIKFLVRSIEHNVRFKENKIIFEKLSINNLNEKSLKKSLDNLIKLYKKLIPKYHNYLLNESFKSNDEINNQKTWAIDLNQNENLWKIFKNNSCITIPYFFENNNIDFSTFKNCYSLEVNVLKNHKKKEIVNIFDFANNIQLNDIVVVIEDNCARGICKINSSFIGFNDDMIINNYYSVEWISIFDDLNIKFKSQKTFYELSKDKWNRLVFTLSKYNKKLLQKVLNYINNSLKQFSDKKLKLYDEYDEKRIYVRKTWEGLLENKQNGLDISDDVWSKLINWCFNDDVKLKVKENTGYNEEDLSNISNLFFDCIHEINQVKDIQNQQILLNKFYEKNNPDIIKFHLSNHFILILHYLNEDFYFMDTHIKKALSLLFMLFGFKFNTNFKLDDYIYLNFRFKEFLKFLNSFNNFKQFEISNFRDFFVFSHLFVDKRLGNFYSNEPNLLKINLLNKIGDFEVINRNPKLNLNRLILNRFLSNFSINFNIINQLCASLNAGKHIILEGTPGTGKTDLAIKFSLASQVNSFINGYVLTTATSDWSTFDTIGGLMPNDEGLLEFHQGKFLEAISEDKWLIIDEINRADIDKAFGPLFTVLSGQDVELPYKINNKSIKICNWNKSFSKFDESKSTYYIGRNWRIIGTMNVADKDSLFDLSYAFMRRFMFVDVDLPLKDDYLNLISDWASDLDDYYVNNLIQLYELVNIRKMGPAIFKDMIEYIKYRCELDDLNKKLILSEAVGSYIVPQLEGLNRSKISDIKELFRNLDILEYLEDQLNYLIPLF